MPSHSNVSTKWEQRYFRVQRKLASARQDGAFTAQQFTPNLLVNLLRIYSIRLYAQNIMLLKQKKVNNHKFGVNFKI